MQIVRKDRLEGSVRLLSVVEASSVMGGFVLVKAGPRSLEWALVARQRQRRHRRLDTAWAPSSYLKSLRVEVGRGRTDSERSASERSGLSQISQGFSLEREKKSV